jgi:hypothetical protein
MSQLELVALIVRDYDAALRFFVDVLQFDLIEDTPSLTNDGRPKRWLVVRPAGGRTGILLARADTPPAASGCSSGSTTSLPPTSAWRPPACSLSGRRETSRTVELWCSWISRETGGISLAPTLASAHSLPTTGHPWMCNDSPLCVYKEE